MRKVSEIKYPNSAKLFSFCKSVLDAKFSSARVIDQDVGQILGFDPADCSNWKKGRKNIRSIKSIDALSKHLDVDPRFLIDIVNGNLSTPEALLEHQGLGHLSLDPAAAESARKNWQRSRGFPWTPELDVALKAFFSINDFALNAVIDNIFTKINFLESPLFLPEISNAFPDVTMITRPSVIDGKESIRDITPTGRWLDANRFEVESLEGSFTRPVVRFYMVRAFAPYFIKDLIPQAHAAFKEHEAYVTSVYCNVFAARLLVPAKLVRLEMSRIDLGRDIVTQLAEVFWVSRSLMNIRLRDILCGSEY